MQYSVEVSELAERQFDNILDYLANEKHNPQAVNGVISDFDNAIDELEQKAGIYGFCQEERLRELGFHKIHLEKHKYVLVYRINGNRVIVEGMYHERQDYENAIG